MGEIGGIAQWSSDQRRKEAIRDSKGPSSPHFTPTRIAEGQGVLLACRVASPCL
jgi:hypothetical protein